MSDFQWNTSAAFGVAAARSILLTRPVLLDITVGGEHRYVEADAVLVTVNRFEGADWRRPRLDGGIFEVHVLNAGGLYSRGKAALSVVSGRWRQSHNLTSFTGEAVTLMRRDKHRGHITFDGEVERKAGPLRYDLLPRALSVIAARAGRPAAG